MVIIALLPIAVCHAELPIAILAANVKRAIEPLNDAQETWKINYIRQALDVNNWNKAQTARDLGVDARTIFRYIEKIEADS